MSSKDKQQSVKAENAERSADTEAPATEVEKVFVLGPGDYTKASGYDHEANYAATRQYAISSGLWPTGDARHVSTKTHRDGVSKELTYAVPVAPAHRIDESSENPEVVNESGSATGAQNADPSSIEG